MAPARIGQRRKKKRSPVIFPLLVGLLAIAGTAALIVVGVRQLANLRRPGCWDESGQVQRLFVAVVSAPGDAEIRSAVRDSWARYGCDYRFFIGVEDETSRSLLELRREARDFGDVVIFEDVVDTYFNLTLKVLLSFAWVHANVRAEYVLKADMDAYVHVERLLKHLRGASREDLFLGRLAPRQKAQHGNTKHKWYMDPLEYPYKYYPPYMMGSGYVVSSDLVPKLAACVPPRLGCTQNRTYAECELGEACTFQPVRFEDATVGGIVFNSVSRSRWLNPDCTEPECTSMRNDVVDRFFRNDMRFLNEPVKYPKACRDDFLVIHRIKPNQMRDYYNAEREGRNASLCPSKK